MIASAYDFVSVLFNNPLYGSNPSIKEIYMAKFNMRVEAFVSTFHKAFSHWVTKAALLALGCWCISPRPYVHSNPSSP